MCASKISIASMLPKEQMFCADPTGSMRKSESAAYADADPTSHHHKGGKNREETLKKDPNVYSLKGEHVFKREVGEL